MTKSNLLMLTAAGVLVAAGLVEACSSDVHYIDVPNDDAGSSSAGKSAAHAGSTNSSAGSMSSAGEPGVEGGAAGSPESEEGGEAGVIATAGGGGSGGAIGDGAGAGGASGGSAGKAGGAGAGGSGVAGSGGGGAGGGGAGGGGAGGGGAGGGGAGSPASAGAAGAPLFVPASATCAAGNVNGAFAVCRNCHGSPTNNGAPVSLVTLKQIADEMGPISGKLTANLMPPPDSNFTITAINKNLILAWINAGAVGVPNASCP
jgi:hypothetical protein